jgi:predicted aconitase with swiveling domain
MHCAHFRGSSVALLVVLVLALDAASPATALVAVAMPVLTSGCPHAATPSTSASTAAAPAMLRPRVTVCSWSVW